MIVHVDEGSFGESVFPGRQEYKDLDLQCFAVVFPKAQHDCNININNLSAIQQVDATDLQPTCNKTCVGYQADSLDISATTSAQDQSLDQERE